MPGKSPQTAGSRVGWLVESVETRGDGLRARGRVPQGLLCFEGHFPGEPVLPGWVQLDGVDALARERLGVASAWTGVEALKFRAPLLPDDAFVLELTAGPPLRFALWRDDALVSEGRLVAAGAPPTQHAARPASVDAPAASLPLRIPQQGPSRLLSRVLSHAGGVTLCRAEIPAAHPLLRGGRAPVWLALELLAQGMAAQGGLELGDALVRRAFVVGARRIELRTRGFAAGEVLWVRAEHVRGESGLVVCDAALGSGAPPERRAEADAGALARGRLTAFVELADPGAASATSSPNPSDRGTSR